jgi:hypothetical protein
LYFANLTQATRMVFEILEDFCGLGASGSLKKLGHVSGPVLWVLEADPKPLSSF